MAILVDVSLSYAIGLGFYVKYRAIELQQFTRGILRDIVRNSLNGVASTNVVEDIYDEGKAELLHKVEARFKQKCHR